jgi:hypothetical protein
MPPDSKRPPLTGGLCSFPHGPGAIPPSRMCLARSIRMPGIFSGRFCAGGILWIDPMAKRVYEMFHPNLETCTINTS